MADSSEIPFPPPYTVEILNLGPVIDPPFADARDWGKLLPQAETKPVAFEQHESALTADVAKQCVELALASDKVSAVLAGKRYEVVGVGTKAIDRATDHPLVIIYNYSEDVVLEAAIDVTARSLLDLAVRHYQPLLSDAESARALAIVRQDGRLAKAGIDVSTGAGIIVVEVNFRSPRYRHRIVDVRFGAANRRVPEAWALVDLTSQDLINIGIYPK